jgi:hypothetical protein
VLGWWRRIYEPWLACKYGIIGRPHGIACPPLVCRAAPALQTCMRVNGLQCSHEDENTRVVCMKAGDVACGAAVSPNRALLPSSTRLEDCICRALCKHTHLVMGYSSTAVAMMLPASKRDEHNGVTGCTHCAWPSHILFLGASQGAPHV